MNGKQNNPANQKTTHPALQRQLLESLRFRVYRRALHPELFEIADRLTISSEGYEATLWVCQAGHVVSFFNNGEVITEVLASNCDHLPTRSLLHDQSVRRENIFEHNALCGMKYISSFQVEKMSDRLMVATRKDFARYSRRGKFIDFGPFSKKPLPGFSYYCYELLPKGLHVMIFHALEEISILIKTQSIFEFVNS